MNEAAAFSPEEASCPVCPTLPSSETAYRFLEGDPAALPLLMRDLVLRSSLVGLGIYMAGERDWNRLPRLALGGGCAIEAFVLGWVWVTACR